MDKKTIAGIAAVALLGGELVEAIDKLDLRSVAADAPHNHVEMPEGNTINVTNHLFASGGYAGRVDYYLQLAPAYGTDDHGNRTVIGYDAYGSPAIQTLSDAGGFPPSSNALQSSSTRIVNFAESISLLACSAMGNHF